MTLAYLFIQQHILQAVETAGIKFPDYKNSGVTLRSQRMKLPSNIGQKKSKGIEQMLQELQMGKNFTPIKLISVYSTSTHNVYLFLT